MGAKRVSEGIFIDVGCHGIIRIDAGYFVPENATTDLTEAEYKADLTAVLLKWFPETGCPPQIKDCS